LTTNYVVTLPNLRRFRLRVPLSQRELAKKAGTAASTVARIEAGEDVHPATARKLAEALGCKPADLMDEQP
jgi:transcriptional regulator with XRE-family HTH domain